MKLNIPKIIKPLRLEVYDESFAGIEVQVWVNPTRDMTNDSMEIQIELASCLNGIEEVAKLEDEAVKKEKLNELQARLDAVMDRQRKWWARILSQKTDETTHWTADEIKTLDEEDTALWNFISFAAAEMIKAHREGSKKF